MHVQNYRNSFRNCCFSHAIQQRPASLHLQHFLFSSQEPHLSLSDLEQLFSRRPEGLSKSLDSPITNGLSARLAVKKPFLKDGKQREKAEVGTEDSDNRNPKLNDIDIHEAIIKPQWTLCHDANTF